MISRDIYIKWIYPICAGLVLLFMILARVLWVGPTYYDLWETISSLYQSDHPEYNPVGAYFFWAAMVVLGVLVLILMLYAHPRLAQGKKFWIRFGSLWMLIGAIGFLLTGLIPQHTLDFISTKFHEDTAAVGALGAFLGAICYGLGGRINKAPLNRTVCLIIFIMWVVFFVIILVSAYGGYFIYHINWSNQQTPLANVNPFFGMSLLEKIGFWMLVAYLGLMGPLFPAKKD